MLTFGFSFGTGPVSGSTQQQTARILRSAPRASKGIRAQEVHSPTACRATGSALPAIRPRQQGRQRLLEPEFKQRFARNLHLVAMREDLHAGSRARADSCSDDGARSLTAPSPYNYFASRGLIEAGAGSETQ